MRGNASLYVCWTVPRILYTQSTFKELWNLKGIYKYYRQHRLLCTISIWLLPQASLLVPWPRHKLTRSIVILSHQMISMRQSLVSFYFYDNFFMPPIRFFCFRFFWAICPIRSDAMPTLRATSTFISTKKKTK